MNKYQKNSVRVMAKTENVWTLKLNECICCGEERREEKIKNEKPRQFLNILSVDWISDAHMRYICILERLEFSTMLATK